MLPEDGQPSGPVTGARVVNMQRAPVTQHKIGLCHHVPSLTVQHLGGASQERPRRGRGRCGSVRRSPGLVVDVAACAAAGDLLDDGSGVGGQLGPIVQDAELAVLDDHGDDPAARRAMRLCTSAGTGVSRSSRPAKS